MTNQDKEVILQLFQKITEVSHTSTNIDQEAKEFIEQEMAKVPNASYYMSNLIMQRVALKCD